MTQRRITIGIRRREESGADIYSPAIIVKDQVNSLFQQTTVAIVDIARGKIDAAREAIAIRDALNSVLEDDIAIAPGVLKDAEYEDDGAEDDAEGSEVAPEDVQTGSEHGLQTTAESDEVGESIRDEAC